jgi:polysaccharide export outer membrane protein
MTASLRLIGALVGITSLLVAAAPAHAQHPQLEVESCGGDYAIGAGDVLEIAVWNNTAVTRTVPVRPDGKISLPLVDDVQAAGLTAMQLRERLTKALVPYIPTPSVSVIVREVHSFKVTVLGHVKTPGRYELKDHATVLDVLALAGGLTEFAARDRIVVIRQDGTTTKRIRFPYETLASANGSNGSKDRPSGAQENFCVRPGDIILVS